MSDWLERASDLLAEPDPGPTPFLVSDLLVDQAVAAVVGESKVSKTWTVLELARAVVTGQPAFGQFDVPQPGPAIVLLEESGRAALHRRLDALARGNAQRPEDFAELWFAANLRVRLDEPDWQARLLTAATFVAPRVVFFDPLVRMKGAGRDENAQLEMAPVLEFLRHLRDESGAAVCFVHHTGHGGGRMRGSSDLEAFWESRLTVERGEDGGRSVRSEHREAEAGPEWRYRLAWDEPTRTMRLAVVEDEDDGLRLRVAAHLAQHPDASKNAVYKALGGRKQDVLRLVDEVRAKGGSQNPGTTGNRPSAAPGSSVVPPAPTTPVGGGAPGTTTNGPVPATGEPPAEELDRLERLAEEMGLG